jgi:hypothetical protein
MKHVCQRVISAAGALALTGGTLAVTALPASAAALPTTAAYGASAYALIYVPALAQASYPGPAASAAFGSNVLHVLSARSVIDYARPASAASHVSIVKVWGSRKRPGLTVRVAASSCAINQETGSATGRATLVGGRVHLGRLSYSLPMKPKVNTQVNLPGAVVTLDKQFHVGSALIVDALSISLPGGETVTAGTSTCVDEIR